MKLGKAAKQRLWFYGTLSALLGGFYFYQPVRIDFLAKPVPVPNPPVDPDSKHLYAKNSEVVVVTAHPDDAEYYLAAFLLKLAKAGAHVHLVVCTDGDKSYYFWQDTTQVRRTRRAEQIEAARHYNADVSFLAFPDGRLHPNDDVVEAVHQKIVQLQPRWLVSFDGAYPPKVSHGDHRSAGQAAFEAAKGTTVRWSMLFASHAPNYTADVSDTEDDQRSLLAIHKSQFAGDKLDAVSDTCLDASMQDGQRIQATYGISFRCVPMN
ncbi:MAG TPA: PIG-L family deacetylase [Fimbriimonas sp.]|nr:PIG-L family deacetylase [Fimbriimonas sp.]